MDQKKSLLFFTNSLGGGGAEMHLLRLLNHLDRDRYRILLAVAHGGGSYETALADQVSVHYLPTGRIDSSTLRLVRAVIPLRKLIRREHPDLVCSVMDYPNLAALQAVRRTGVPLVLVVQSNPVRTYKNGEGLLGSIAYRLMATTYPAANHIVALSRGVAQRYEQLLSSAASSREGLSIIYNAGFDDDVLAKAGEPLPKNTFSSEERPLIVACGRLVEQKGFPYLLEAVAQVRSNVQVDLLILGEGKKRHALETQAKDLGIFAHVSMPGFVQNPYQYMAAADVFVLSSLHEGFGNVVVEAMACGTPVVSTDCPHGPAEIITHEQSGLLVPPADSGALANGIGRVLSDEELRQRMIREGRKRAHDFKASKIARDYEKLFEKLLRDTS